MARSILTVMNQISAEIPTWYDPEKRASLEKTFLHLRKQIRFSAPELHPSMWVRVCSACVAHLPDPDDPDAPWATRVAAILYGPTVPGPQASQPAQTTFHPNPSDESASDGPLPENPKSVSS